MTPLPEKPRHGPPDGSGLLHPNTQPRVRRGQSVAMAAGEQTVRAQLGSVCLGTLGCQLNSVLYEWSHVTPGHPQALLGTHDPFASGTPRRPEKCDRVGSAGPQGAPRRQAALTLKRGAAHTPGPTTVETSRGNRDAALGLPGPALRSAAPGQPRAGGSPAPRKASSSSSESTSCHLNATQMPRRVIACKPLPQAQHCTPLPRSP